MFTLAFSCCSATIAPSLCPALPAEIMPPRSTPPQRKVAKIKAALYNFFGNFFGNSFGKSLSKLRDRFLRLPLGVQACLLLLALLLFNAALSPLSERKWDWTEEKLATLSPDAEKFLGKLTNDYRLTLYASAKIVRDIPAYADYERRASALLSEMARHSKNKKQRRLAFTLTRPEPFDPSEDEALESGLSPLAIDQSGEQVFFGLKITREKSKTRTQESLLIPFLLLEREQTLEYEVMRSLVELEREEKPRIALVTSLEPLGGYSGGGFAGGFGSGRLGGAGREAWRAFQALEADFDIDTLFVSEDFDAQKTDLLIFLHPRIQDEELLYALDQYMLKGGKALLFLDPHYESTSPSRRSSLNTTIPFASNEFPLLERWGLKIPSDIVADARYAMLVNAGDAQQVEPVPHLAWLQLPEEAIADREPTRAISSLILASAGTIKEAAIEKAASLPKPIPKTISIAPLLRSSDESDLLSRDFFATTPPELLQAYEAFSPQQERNALGVVVKGRYRSLFEETPKGMQHEEAHIKASTQDFQAVVIADADFLNDRFWVERKRFLNETLYTPFSGNGAFLLNAVEWLIGIEGLAGLRARGVGNRPLVYLERLRLKAEGRWRLEQQALDQKLQEIEQRIADLRQAPSGQLGEQKQAGEQASGQAETQRRSEAEQTFVRQLVETRGALRKIQRALNRDVGAMQTFVQVFHASAMPLAVVVFFLLRAWRKKQKTNRKTKKILA